MSATVHERPLSTGQPYGALRGDAHGRAAVLCVLAPGGSIGTVHADAVVSLELPAALRVDLAHHPGESKIGEAHLELFWSWLKEEQGIKLIRSKNRVVGCGETKNAPMARGSTWMGCAVLYRELSTTPPF